MKKPFFILPILYMLSIINLSASEKTITAKQLNKNVKIIGNLGFPLGYIIKIDAKIIKSTKLKRYEGKFLLQIHKVNDQKLDKPIILEYDNINDKNTLKLNEKITCMGFETGGFKGLPKDSFTYIPQCSSTEFYFSTSFFILKKTTNKAKYALDFPRRNEPIHTSKEPSQEMLDKTPFSTKISKLWKDAKKRKVLGIGNKILQKDPQNIIGLLIRMEYEISYLELDKLEKTMKTLQRNIKNQNYSSENLKKELTLLEGNIQVLSASLKRYPSKEKKADLEKAYLKGKDISCIYIIRAAEKNGCLPKGINY